MLAKYSYLPYGQLNIGGGLPLNVGFTGHHWDAETGMYFAPFRYYMPGAGRWLSRDPLGFVEGPNLYGYVGGHPVNSTDPMGLGPFKTFGRFCLRVWNWMNPVKEKAEDVADKVDEASEANSAIDNALRDADTIRERALNADEDEYLEMMENRIPIKTMQKHVAPVTDAIAGPVVDSVPGAGSDVADAVDAVGSVFGGNESSDEDECAE